MLFVQYFFVVIDNPIFNFNDAKTSTQQCLLFVIITRMEINEYNVEPKHMKAHYIALKAFGIHMKSQTTT